MKQLLLKRLLQAVLMAWSVGTLTFVLVKALPGDLAYKIAAGRYGEDAVSAAAAEAVRAELGLNQSGVVQYFEWLKQLVTLDLGRSLVSGAPVVEELYHQLGYTLSLAIWGLLVSVCIAFPVGVLSGYNPKGSVDRAALVGATFVRAQPVFTLGLLLIFAFALGLKWFPVAGFGSSEYVVLPALTLGLSLAAMSNRLIRNSTITVVRASFFEFAQIKGLSPTVTFFRHGVVNIFLPVLAFIGVQLIGLIEGIIMVESLFAWPGIGHGLSHAVFSRDIPMLQGTALVMGVLFVAVNTLVDIATYTLDPRVGKA